MTSWLLLAQEQGPAAAPSFGLFLPVILVLLFFFVVLLPANRRQKREQEAMQKSLKRGSKVLTSSGIYGTVVSLKDDGDEMVIRSEDSRLKVKKSMVIQVLGSDDAEAGK